MRNFFLSISIILCSYIVNGQEIELNFEGQGLDSWYSNQIQHWQVSDDSPLSGNYSLRHSFDNPESSEDWIAFYHPPLFYSGVEQSWEFTLRYDFAPSANNKWAIFIGNNCLLPFGSLENAIVLGVNFDTSDDLIKIWHLSRGGASVVMNTGINWEEVDLSAKPVKFILRKAHNIITLSLRVQDEQTLVLGESPVHISEQINSFLLYYKYSSTYDRGLTIDDIKISGEFGIDTSAPNLVSTQVSARNKLEIVFDEPMIAPTLNDFCIAGIGCARAESRFGRTVELAFENEFAPGRTYKLQLPKMEDVAGNSIQNEFQQFYYPGAYDVVLNEIMADPSPEVELPNVEYVELFNRTEETISLKGWRFSANGKSVLLPECSILPKDYLLLVEEGNEAEFEENIPIIGIEELPALRNSDANLVLQDRMGSLVHAIAYSENWQESGKSNGGWSLELVNPDEACTLNSNWVSSIDPRGGTPGLVNSVFSKNSESMPPELWRASAMGLNTVRLYFSAGLDSLRSSSADFFLLKPNLISPIELQPAWPITNSIDLQFPAQFVQGQEYELSLSNDITDCGGRQLSNKHVKFQFPETASEGDVVINEIMFDPLEGMNEYVELYNRSEKAIELHNWRIQIEGKESINFMEEYFTLLPGSFAVVSSSLHGISSPDLFPAAAKLIQMAEFPALKNSGSLVTITDSLGILIDQAVYNPEWHHKLLDKQKGVALERVSADNSGMDSENWRSAASLTNYQSPGLPNSHLRAEQADASLQIEPKSITPNGDGWNDVLQITYVLPESAYMARLLIFDTEGNLIKSLGSSLILGTQGTFEFDGTDENNRVLQSGFYILYFEAYNENGFRFAGKKSFVVAGTN